MRVESRKLLSLGLSLGTLALAACGDDNDPFPTQPPPGSGGEVVVDTATITGNRRFDRDTVYVLRGFVKVASGGVLTIEPGTRIVGDTLTPGSALFVLPGGRLVASGTAEEPIVFTSQRSANNRRPGDWGGLVIVGRGRINRTSSNPIIEGSNAADVRGTFAGGLNYGGGSDNADDSGTLRYVRVEFAGYGEVANQELNSVTLAAVGSGTTIEYVQSMAGLDDSFEWFGGAVNGRFLVSYESGDDHFDASEGYVGRNQYLIAFQSTILAPQANSGTVAEDPQGFEVDGCNGAGCAAPAGGNAQSSQPYNMPVFANFTLVGTGDVNTASVSGGVGMVLRRGTGGVYVNGIVARYPRRGISLRDSTTFNREAADSLVVSNILLAGNAGGNFDADSVRTRLGASGFEESAAAVASLFTAFPTTVSAATTAASFDWTPGTGSAALTGGTGATFPSNVASRTGTFVTSTTFRGAAPPAGQANARWWEGWTVYYQR